MLPSFTSPEGKRKFESLTARATSVTEMPLEYRRSRFRLTVIWRILPPSTLAEATPESRSSWGSTLL